MQHWASGFIEILKKDETVLNRRGFTEQAKMVRSIVVEAEERQREFTTRTVTLSEAEAYSKVSRRTLERWLADGSLTQAGDDGAPRVFLCELPTPVRKLDSVTAARAAASRHRKEGKPERQREEGNDPAGLPELKTTEIAA